MTTSAAAIDREFKGNLPIVPTPFDENGDLAVREISMMIDYYERCGVEGVTILGVMGEASKLSSSETQECITEFLRCAEGRLAVVTGVSGQSLARSVEIAEFAAERGGAGVMLMPLSGLNNDAAVVNFYERFVVYTGGRVAICVQDDPPVSAVALNLSAWCQISRLEPVVMLKHEPIPGLQKLSRILDAQDGGEAERVSVLTSSNAMYLPQELARGCDGSMVGVAYQDAIVQICRLYWQGQVDAAFDLHDALLPLIRHEKQGVFGLAVRKEILRRRGAMNHATVRYPGAELELRDLEELDRLIQRFEARLSELSISLPVKQAA